MILFGPGLFYPELPLGRRELESLVGRLMGALDLPGAEFELKITDDAEIAHLNQAFLGLGGPTNVLSFPAEDPERPGYLGEMALSAETAVREAFLYGQDPTEHFTRLLCHGLLHLAGFDHGDLMDELTERALAL